MSIPVSEKNFPGLGADSARRAIVVGASSGIGRALAKQLIEEGWQVVALARRVELLKELREEIRAVHGDAAAERLTHREHDVNHAGEVTGLFDEIVGELGGLELLIYGAAIMPEVAADEFDSAKDLAMLQVNL
ncbi:MAG: NAD(P)-dependent dehydrogenase (short-subunit alcohol dehydrogenase family), partial [Planctomycetota bacterium]